MSSSMFTNMKKDGTVVLGHKVGKDGMVRPSVSGLRKRGKSIKEAIRTELLQTYSTTACGNATDGQLPNVGNKVVPQNPADGFMLKKLETL